MEEDSAAAVLEAAAGLVAVGLAGEGLEAEEESVVAGSVAEDSAAAVLEDLEEWAAAGFSDGASPALVWRLRAAAETSVE